MAKIDVKPLVEKYNDLLSNMEAITNKAVEETRAMTEEETNSFNEIRGQADDLKKTIDMANEERELMEFVEPKRVPSEDNEERAFESWLRTGAESRALAKTDNGAVVPVKIANRIIETVKELAPILELADTYYTAGKLVFPVWNDSYVDASSTTHYTAANYVNEFTDVTEDSGKFTSVELTGFIAGILVKISKSLINNAEFDIVSYIVRKVAEKIAEFLNKECIIGTNQKMTGIVSSTNTVTTASATAISADELIDLQLAVPQVYQKNAVWFMSPEVFAKVRKLKDGAGQYLVGGYQNGLVDDMGFTLLGRRVYLDDNMATSLTASAKSIVYGDMKGLAIKFSDRLDLEILREKYAAQYAVGVVAHCEADSKIVDNSMIAVLVQHA